MRYSRTIVAVLALAVAQAVQFTNTPADFANLTLGQTITLTWSGANGSALIGLIAVSTNSYIAITLVLTEPSFSYTFPTDLISGVYNFQIEDYTTPTNHTPDFDLHAIGTSSSASASMSSTSSAVSTSSSSASSLSLPASVTSSTSMQLSMTTSASTKSSTTTSTTSGSVATNPTSSKTATSSTPSNSILPTPSETTSSSGGFTEDQKIAIGVGLGVGIPPIILAVIGLCIQRQRRTHGRRPR